MGIIVRKGVRFNNYSIDIGNYIYIGENTLIENCARIGSYCSISEGVKLGLKNHPHTHLSTFPLFYSAARGWLAISTYDGDLTKPLIIEPDVLISANAIIMTGIKIGVGAIIGAGAVITKDVPHIQ